MRLAFRLIVLLVVLGGIALFWIDRDRYGGTVDPKASQPERERQAVAAAKALEERARRNLVEHPDGRHCLDPATGMHPAVTAYARARVRDPASFEHVATELAPVNLQGQHLLKLTYRTRSENGGPRQMSETFVMQNSDCSFER